MAVVASYPPRILIGAFDVLLFYPEQQPAIGAFPHEHWHNPRFLVFSEALV